ncbi:MAG TPA: SEC-C metal-binding domain-containing protein, partial [Negativicutes bacterium]|nr:SEC-C metal-binding domain-containing protein [Negativicutes bacterium]
MPVERNDPCSCGSGKKYKKCCMNKKPVIESAMFEYSEPTRLASFSIGPNRELMAFDSEGKPIQFREASYLRSYKREGKGEKTLTRIPMFSPTLPQHELEYLLSFHAIYAIDTNTDKETKISAATAIKCDLTIVDQTKAGNIIKGQVLIETEIIDRRYWIDLDVNPEKAAIQNLIMRIGYLPGAKIGIINDCDLG